MATDGIKIIDGDLANDTYNQIMDLYDSEVEIDTIKKELPFKFHNYGFDNDFYHEIFVTSYSLAFWEIGELTENMFNEVKRVINLKAGVKTWTEECDESEGLKRQEELDKFLKKISKPKSKIRKRKKYKLITNFYYQLDEVLIFRMKDKSYRAMICAKITQYKGQCTYEFAMTTYDGNVKPTLNDLKSHFIAGHKIGSGYEPEVTLSYQPNVDKIWEYSNESNFFFGIAYYIVNHRNIINIKDKFEVIGKLKIEESFKKEGSYCYERTFERFEEIFMDIDDQIKTFRQQKYPVKLICEL